MCVSASSTESPWIEARTLHQWMQDVDNVLLSGSSTDGIHDDGRDIRQAIVSYFSE